MRADGWMNEWMGWYCALNRPARLATRGPLDFGHAPLESILLLRGFLQSSNVSVVYFQSLKQTALLRFSLFRYSCAVQQLLCV